MFQTMITDQPTRQKLAAQDRSARGMVTGKLRRAIIEMVWCGSCRDDAAKSSGMSVHGLREALRRPHVKHFYLRELDVLKTSERARNILALVDVRDNAENSMARVQAARSLEQLADDANNPASGRGAMASVPGFVILVSAAHLPKDVPASPIVDVPPLPPEPEPQSPTVVRQPTRR
jgi:hypothetical protein